jgi:hypothetical protein
MSKHLETANTLLFRLGPDFTALSPHLRYLLLWHTFAPSAQPTRPLHARLSKPSRFMPAGSLETYCLDYRIMACKAAESKTV